MIRACGFGAGVIVLCAAICINVINCNNSPTGPQNETVSLSGTITNSDGSPLVGATVTTLKFKHSDSSDVLKAKTDDQGRFSIKGTYVPPAPKLTAKRTAAARDTIIAVKKEYIDARIPIDSYTKQNIVAAVSLGVLRTVFPISNSMIPGWKMSYSTIDSTFTMWSVDNLWQDIDGGFERYTNRGMLQAGDLTMVGPINSEGNPYTLDIHSFIMDFGTESNSKSMFDKSKTDFFDTESSLVPGYDNSAAFAKDALGGITVYAYYKKFYFELILSNYPEKDKALADAKVFLDYFKSKIQ
jgi:hypothetical protein